MNLNFWKKNDLVIILHKSVFWMMVYNLQKSNYILNAIYYNIVLIKKIATFSVWYQQRSNPKVHISKVC